MKPILEIVKHLRREGVAECILVSGYLPCVKANGALEAVDEVAPSIDDLLGALLELGGLPHVDGLGTKGKGWNVDIDGVGTLSVLASRAPDKVQIRIVRKPEPATRAPDSIARGAVPAVLGGAPVVVRNAPPEPVRASHRPVSIFANEARLDGLLQAARQKGASDLHLVAGRPPLMRIRGVLEASGAPLEREDLENLLLSRIPERLVASFEQEGSCDFALEVKERGRFRTNIARQRTGLKGSFRVISETVPTLEALGLPDAIAEATHHHQGLIVVTGPTGHGKTTTLAAIVDILNTTTTHHVITVEDPIEYVHPRKRAMMSQREVGTHTRSFGSALKASLREDPDVIVVGELRDTETVRMALSASETGHLVIGTMNTPSAAKTIDRLIDLFPPEDQPQVRMTLAGGLRLIVSQRLLPRARGVAGSPMVAAAELLPGSIALWTLIRDGKTYQIPSLQQRGKGVGILRLDDSLVDLVGAGQISKEEALASAEAPEELKKRIA